MNLEADLLEAAADALESGRIVWAKYSDRKRIPAYGSCALETLDVVAGELMPQERERKWAVIDGADKAVSLHVTHGMGRQHLTSWNDADARTLDEVIQAFKETAKELRNKPCTTPLPVL